jgi:alkylation response protein AidB-like acyl-CoA dehydrogenase
LRFREAEIDNGMSRAEILPLDLTDSQQELYAGALGFVREQVKPIAAEIDSRDCIPQSLLERMGEHGFWRACVPECHGGAGMDNVSLGVLCRALGRECAALLSVFTVHSMLCATLSRWGTKAQREHWLPRLASGEILGMLALTEPHGGSDAADLRTIFRKEVDAYVATGVKRWISAGRIAGGMLIFGLLERRPTAFIARTPLPGEGFVLEPISGLLGFRGAMLAELRFEDCRLPEAEVVGRPGFGLAMAGFALDVGRLCISWGCLGMSEACLEMAAEFSRERVTFRQPLGSHPLIQRMLCEMLAETTAARLVCFHSARARDAGGSATIESTLSKYICAQTVRRVSENALQILGARGLEAGCAAQRYWRDAKIMELIEGATQLQEMILGGHVSRQV